MATAIRESPELDAVQRECLDLLIVYYTYAMTLETCDPSAGTRFDLHRWWVQLRIFENDMILRLCRMDDDDRNNHSLREALKSVRAEINPKILAGIDTRIKKYRKLINPLKTKARNYYIAHLSKAATVPHDPQGGLERPISEVVNLVDLIAGSPVRYSLRVGSQERELDLRLELTTKKS